jgi:hypothetical protein
LVYFILKKGGFQVLSVKDETWAAQIDEGLVGCTKVIWAPDGRTLLSFSDFEVVNA